MEFFNDFTDSLGRIFEFNDDIGDFYTEEGDLGDVDDAASKAVKWWRLGTLLSEWKPGFKKVADAYRDGFGVEKDFDKALEYYRKSDEGNTVKYNTDLFLAEKAENEGDCQRAYNILHKLKHLCDEYPIAIPVAQSHNKYYVPLDKKLAEICVKCGYYEEACDL